MRRCEDEARGAAQSWEGFRGAFPWSQAEEQEAADGARCGDGLRQGHMERRGHGEERVDPWLFL